MASSDKDKIASSDSELEEELQKAGNRLLDELPSSVDELLDLLDRIENGLSRVEQSPPETMQIALSSTRKALVASSLMNHSDEDVKVSVASCISEITRITAPDAPYDDDQMKVVFQLIVSSFEKLDDKSNRSYNKRTSILETVAKVRSCVVMLDLECDALIIEMLHYLLTTIRDYHPPNVVSSMETIMTLVLEESEDISLEILSPILASVKKHNEEVVPIARRLAEKVLEKCATKIRPVLIQSVKSMDISLNDYSIVVAHICQEAACVDEKTDTNASAEHSLDESKLVSGASSNEAPQVPVATEAVSHEEADPADDSLPKPVMNNGISQTKYENFNEDVNSLKNPEHSDSIKQSKSDDVLSEAEHDSIGAEKIVESKVQPKKKSKRRGKKRKTPKKATKSLSVNKTKPPSGTVTEPPSATETEPPSAIKTEPPSATETKPPSTETEPPSVTETAAPPVTETGPSGSSLNIDEKESEKLPVSEKSQSKEVCSSSREVTSPEAGEPIDSKTVTDIEMSSPKTLESDNANAVPSSPIGSQGDEINSPKDGKLKEGSIQEPAVSETANKTLSESTLSFEFKTNKRSGKKACAGIPEEDTIPAQVDTSREDSETASDPEVKSLREAGKIVDSSDEDEQESSKKQKIEKKTGKGKASVQAKKTKSSTKYVDKESVSISKSAKKSAEGEGHLEETPKTSSKRKRTPEKETVCNSVELGKNLVGKKIKVYWPEDEKFYEGIVGSWDGKRRKHKVLYTDGDEEILYLKTQRWELVEGDSVSDREQGTPPPCLDDSAEMQPNKKAKSSSNSSKGKTHASSSKSGGAGSSNKSKGATAKSGSKSKSDNKSKDVITPKGSKSVDSSKASGKTKNVETETPKSSKKSEQDTPKTATKKLEQDTSKIATKKLEQDTPKTATKVKGKSPNSSAKPSSNGTGKLKSGSSSKVKEDVEEDNSPEEPLKAMRKTPDSSSKAKTGKKRRKGGR